jgi:hypothetical protein
MVTCGSRKVIKKNRVRKNIAYLVINISPSGLITPPLLENMEEGEYELLPELSDS